MDKNQELAVPRGLSAAGRKAANTILGILRKHGMTRTGGCRTFHTPKEWTERGELYGRGSLLIVVYDGGEVAPFFNPCDNWLLAEEMQEALHKMGLYAEEMNCWSAAIYPTQQ